MKATQSIIKVYKVIAKLGDSFLVDATFSKIHILTLKMENNLKKPMLNVNYVVINEITKFK
jgi:predicted ABC-type ATPase